MFNDDFYDVMEFSGYEETEANSSINIQSMSLRYLLSTDIFEKGVLHREERVRSSEFTVFKIRVVGTNLL